MKKQILLICLILTVICASHIAYANNLIPSSFFENLKYCRPDSATVNIPFGSHNLVITKKIYGMQNNSCYYSETAGNGGMECHLPVSSLSSFAKYMQITNNGQDFTVDLQTDGNKSYSKQTVDGKQVDNMLQYAFDKGYCKFK